MGVAVTSGVYIIRNQVEGGVYVGSSVNIEERWRGHRRLLTKGSHHSWKLQSAWDRLGPEAFLWEVIERLPPVKDTLVSREQFHLDSFDAYHGGYNSRPDADSCLGIKRPPFTPEHRRKIAEAKKGCNNPNYGKPRPQETRDKIAASNRGQTRSAETRARLSESRSGVKNWNRGKKLSPDRARALTEAGHAALRGQKQGEEQVESRRRTLKARGYAVATSDLQRDLPLIRDLFSLLAHSGEVTYSRWTAHVQAHKLPLRRACYSTRYKDVMIYARTWREFAALVTAEDTALGLPSFRPLQ